MDKQQEEIIKKEKARAWLNESQGGEVKEKGTTSFGSSLSFIFEILKVVIIALVFIFLIRYYLIKPFYVKGASMEPTFYDNEYLVIDEISYRFTAPSRGDVIVFRYPKNPSQIFIKRIIGLPGETIELVDSSLVIKNSEFPDGFTLQEDYLYSGVNVYDKETVTLGQDEYFVMGDNRNSSLDSRRFGSVPKENIIGKTWFRAWPFNRFHVFKQPVYSS